MTRATSTASPRDPDGPVAIVGIGCRYADIRGPEAFWEIVRSGRDTVREVPRHRVELGYDIDHFYDPRPRTPGRVSSKKGGFLEHPELFDPAAFGIAPRDALTMDPQQRLMVEVTWDALEDAGIVPSAIAGERVAVVLGYMAEDYSRERTGVLGEEAVFRGHDVFTVGGMSHAVLSGRIAFLLGVTGPSFTLDTACSSSLIATHLACQSLRRGEADMALAGGANLFLSPEGNIALSRSGMLSMSGACRAFDASADGFVRAEGAGVVVLKRLADAIADDDPIYAVIRGSGISTDGRDGGHMMAPGRKGQAQAMRDAYAQADLDPSRIQYVETHGTGTMIGDPVEIGALADVMGPGRDPEKPLRVASVKGHLGHTESASGVAGLIQACLAIRHRTLPAQMHFETPSPAIPWDEIPIRVQTELAPWPESGPALVGVNSFGISGTNAHVVLESPPDRAPGAAPPTRARGLVLPLSAQDPDALTDMARALRDRLEDASDEAARDVLHTLATRRERRPHRLAVAGESIEQLRTRLRAHLADAAPDGIATGLADPDRRPQVVMVFPGQGSQWLGMGRSLLRDEPAFAEAIDRLDAAYREHVDWSLRAQLETPPADADGSPERDWTKRLDVLQPVLVAFEIALAELWKSWGVVPDRVIGQSMGEIAAAHVAGALDLAAVARLACHRGRIVARAKGRGAMALVSSSREEVERRIAARAEHDAGRLEIAGVNAPSATIVAGDRAAITDWVEALDAEGIFARVLDVDFASHCFQMDPLLAPFREGLDGLAPDAVRIPMHSTVDGETKSGAELDADYWVRNLRSAVALDLAVERATEAGGEIFLELSAHPTLSRALGECAGAAGRSIHFVGSLMRDTADAERLAQAVGELFVAGAPVDFERFGPPGRVTRLPLYPYQRERYWFSERTRLDTFRPRHPLLGEPVDHALSAGTRLWSFLLDADTAGFARDLEVDGRFVVPTATLVELAVEAGRSLWPDAPCEITDLRLGDPIVLAADERRVVQVVVRTLADDRVVMTVASRPASTQAEPAWTGHGEAMLVAQRPEPPTGAGDATPNRFDVEAFEGAGRERFDEAMGRCGVTFGPRTRSLRELGAASDDAGSTVTARLQLPRSVETEWQAYHAHPAMIETALQLGGLLGSSARDGGTAIEIDSIRSASLPTRMGSEVYARADLRPEADARDGDGFVFDCLLFDPQGAPLGRIDGVRAHARPLARGMADQRDGRMAGVAWQTWVPPLSEHASASRPPLDRWIVVSDDTAQADLVAAELRKRGTESRFCDRVEALPSLALAMTASDDRPWGLLVLAWGDAPDASPESSGQRSARISRWAEAIRAEAADADVVWIATRGLWPVAPSDAAGSPAARAIADELDVFMARLELDRCRFFDASADLAADEHGQLATTLRSEHAERWVASREGALRVPRLVPLASTSQAPTGGPRRRVGERNVAALRVPGARRDHEGRPRAGVALCTVADVAPADHEVVVEVRSASLCRLDVRAALDERTGAERALGHDFVGRIVATGASVGDRQVGELVLGVHRGSLRRRVVLDARAVAPIVLPSGSPAFEPTRLAVLPELVARHALSGAARVTPDDTVLVDVGSGPVAQAVVRHARALGARVRVVARSARSRARLERLDVPLEAPDADGTDGSAPVTVVVSDAPGAGARRLAARLRAGGRFVDLRAREPGEVLGAEPLEVGPNRTLLRIDSVALVEDEPALAAPLLARLGREATGRPGSASSPSSVPTCFPIGEIDRALRYAAQHRQPDAVTLDFTDVADAAAIERDGIDGRFQRFERIVLDGDARPAIASLAEALRAEGIDAIEVASPTTPARDDDCRTLRLSVETAQHAGRRALREAAVASAATRVFVSLRPEATGDETADRSWIAQLWLDRLIRPDAAREPAASWQELSVSASARPETILDAVAFALRNDSEAVVVDVEGLEPSQAPSPFTEALATTPARETGLLELEPEARRERILALVRNEVGTVLGLSEEQGAALAGTRRLDSLGLDSLMSLELFVGLGRTLGLEIERDWFASIPSLGAIASVLAERLAESTEVRS